MDDDNRYFDAYELRRELDLEHEEWVRERRDERLRDVGAAGTGIPSASSPGAADRPRGTAPATKKRAA